MKFNPLYCVYGNFVIAQRYVMVIMMQLALLHAYHLRIVLNIAISQMKRPANLTGLVDECPEYEHEDVDVKEETFHWSNNIESLILYAFYIGYIISHVPGGRLADKYGARHVFGTCMLLSIVVNMLYPLAIIYGGTPAAVALRAILGISQGPLYPSISTFIQDWIPTPERGFLGGVAFGGANLGTITGSLLTGYMIEKSNSWALPFYVWGVLAFVWYMFYLFMVFSTPRTHPFITQNEFTYLDQSIPEKKSVHVPWKKLAISIPIYALILGQFGHNFLFFTIFTYLPKYLTEILKLNITNVGIFTGVPFGMMWVGSLLFGWLADFITNRGYMSIKNQRRLWAASSLVLPAICLVLVPYTGCNRLAALALVTIALFIIGMSFAGVKVNVNDLSIYHSGTIQAFVNGLGATAGIIGPLTVGLITGNRSLATWRTVFWIMFAVANVCAFLYWVMMSAQRQKWDYQEGEEEGEQQK